LIRSILKRGMEKGVFRSVKLDSLPEVLFSIYKMLVIRTYIAQEGTSMRRMFAETLEVVTLGIFKQPRARRGTGKQ